MELTPDLLLEAKFAPARRGYDMAEVDDFLERCAEGLDVLLARLKAEFERAERAEAELQRRRSDPQAGTDQPAASGVAAETPPAPAAERPAPADVSVDEPMRILVHAERTAEAAIADARTEAERIRSEAEAVASTQRSEAEAMLAAAKSEAETEARRAGDEVRRTIQSEVMALRKDRDVLNDDVRNLRRWLDDQRARLRTTARDLQRLVDDPGALRDLPVPTLSDAEAGAAEDGDDPAGAVAEDAGHDVDDSTGARKLDVDDADDGEPTQAVPAVPAPSIFDEEAEADKMPPRSANAAHSDIVG